MSYLLGSVKKLPDLEHRSSEVLRFAQEINGSMPDFDKSELFVGPG